MIHGFMNTPFGGGEGEEEDRNETAVTCTIKGRFGRFSSETSPELQPLASGQEHALCEHITYYTSEITLSIEQSKILNHSLTRKNM